MTLQDLIIETDEWLENNAQSDRWEREVKFAELIILKCAKIVATAVALREPASTCVSKILELKNERTNP